MNNGSYSIIIPAHNEEQRISPTLEAYARYFPDSEIIVVLNGCSDGTIDRVLEIGQRFPNIYFVEIEEAVGKGGAIRTGLLLAHSPVVGYVDADGATGPEEFEKLLAALSEPDDGIIASRWIPGAVVNVKQPWIRRFASRSFNFLVNSFFSLGYNDTQCGAKVFRAHALKDVLGRLETSNLAFDVELLYELRKQGRVVREVPTVWNDVAGTKVNLPAASKRMFLALVRLRIRESILRVVIPAFDRFLPTAPMRTRAGLRILVINWRDIKHPQAGGAETYLHEICKRIAASGNHVEWLTARFPGCSAKDSIDGIEITRTGNRFSIYLAAGIEYLRKFRDRFDLIIDSSNGIPFFSPLFSLKPKLLVLYHVHQKVFAKHLPPGLSHLLQWLEARFVPYLYRNHTFVTISEDTKREMLELGMTSSHVPIVHPGYDPALAPGDKSKEPSILYLGRLKGYKRVDLLMHALVKVHERIPNAILNIAGTGDQLEPLKALAERLGISSSVVFHGFVDDDVKRELLQKAWVFASASEMEGWGIGVIEANACGTPAVAFDTPGLREAIRDGDSGIIVPWDRDIADALIAVLGDASRRDSLSKGAILRASELSWDTAADRIMEAAVHEIGRVSFTLIRASQGWRVASRRGPRQLQQREDPPSIVALSAAAANGK